MVALAAQPVVFALPDETIYVGKVAGGERDHAIGTLHHSTIVHVDHHGDHWLAKLADGQQVNFECAGSPITPMGYDCIDVLTWRLFDGKPQVVNLIGNTLVPGDIDYGDQKLYEDAVSTDPKARRSYGGKKMAGEYHAKPQTQPKPITFVSNRVMPLWSKTWGRAIGCKFYPADPKCEMASFKVETMPDPRFGIRNFISELDKIVGLWQVTYRKVNGHCELIEIKECDMADQPAEKTDTLNDAIGSWFAKPENEKMARLECKKLIIKAKIHVLYYPGTPMKEIEPIIQNQWIPAMLKVKQGEPLSTSPFDSWITAEAHAKEWIETMKAKPSDHKHVYEAAKCKVCGQHWAKDENERKALHAWVDELFAGRSADEKTHDDQYEFVKECNEVEHLEETDKNPQQFREAPKQMVEDLYPLDNAPDKLAKELMGKWLAEFKTIRTDVTDKNEAIKLVAALFSEDPNAGLHTVTALVANVGVDGAQKQWDELKGTLKPAQPKNGTHPPEDKPAQTPATEQKPKPAQQTQTTSNAVATVPQSIVTINSPELAALEAKKQEAMLMIKSGLLPKTVDTPEKVIVIAMMGEALGIEHKIVALNMINVIAGKPAVSPQLMLAMVKRSSAYESFSCSDDGNACTVRMKRKGEDEHVEVFSMDDARRMMTTEWENGNKKTIPLADKANWKQQPQTMRKWRAIAAACRVVFPDVIWGLYTTEELDTDTDMSNTIDAEFVEKTAA